MLIKFISAAKSILILVLAVVAVYQVSELWLVTITNRNFFLYIQARFPAAVPDGQSAWVMPRRVITGSGDGRYAIRYSRISGSYEWEYARFAFSRILADGEHVDISGYPYNDISYRLSPHITFEYSFPINITTFANAMGLRRSRASAGTSFTSFCSVTLLPPVSRYCDSITAIFRNGDTEWRFALNLGTRRNQTADFLFDVPPIESNDLYFARVYGGFTPIVPEGFTYNVVQTHNPFQNVFGLLHLSTIRPRIEHFFDNPATIIPGPSRDVYTFSNINVRVRYLQFDVLEYTSFRPIGRTAPANLVSDFSAALAFINNDPYVINEIFLAGYEIRGSDHVFQFGYVINNFPLVLTSNWFTEPGCREPLRSPIEVTVSHGRIVRYRRIAQNFIVSDVREVFVPGVCIESPAVIGFAIANKPALSLEIFERGQ